MLNTISPESNWSKDTEKRQAIALSESILGYPLPDSHFEMAVRDTKQSALSMQTNQFH